MSSSSLAKASFRLPWGREEVMVAVEAIVAELWVVSVSLVLFADVGLCLDLSKQSLSLLSLLVSVV